MLDFQFDISDTAIVLFGIALVMVVPFVIISLRPLWRVANAIKQSSTDDSDPEESIAASIVVYATNEADSLRKLLPTLLGQHYNGPFEVIVVNEGQSDATAEVVERLRMIHDNLYLTYTPDGARQLSRKKLALMIGIKAARYPVVVQTIASANIDSDMWLARMTAPFSDPNVEVVLGAGTLDTTEDVGIGRRSRLFNSVADTIIWLNSALSRRPYRGTELNLAYTREVFFANRGFSRSLNLKYGDDDIFIHEIARPDNTAVVLHPDAIVGRKAWNVPRVYRNLRSRYIFTGQRIPRTARYLNGLGNLLLWAIVALCIAGAVVMLPNLFGVTIAAVIVLSLAVVTTIFWRKAIRAISGKAMMFSLAGLAFMRPLANVVAKLKSLRHRKSNYTWVK